MRGWLLFGIISERFVHFLGNLNFNITKSRRASDSLNPTLLNNQIPRSEIFQSKDFQSIKLHRIIIIFLVMMMVSGFISSVFVRIIFTSGIQGDDHIKSGERGRTSTDKPFDEYRHQSFSSTISPSYYLMANLLITVVIIITIISSSMLT